MGGKHWISRSDSGFDGFLEKYCEGVQEYTGGAVPVWSHIPAARVTELVKSRAAWRSAFSRLEGAHTSGDVLAKREQRAESEAVLRDFNRSFVLYVREVTDAQRRNIGCPVHSRHSTPVPAPKVQATADVVYLGVHLLQLVNIKPVQDRAGEEEAKAEFGVRICWGILGPATETDRLRLAAPPETGNDLPHSVFIHRKRYRFDFEGDSGKTVYFCLRYENGKGGKEGEGPFGPLFSAIIP
jgi:hypothetical protein